MKKPPDSPEFERFTEAMRQVLTVSKAELQRRMEEEREKKRIRAGHKKAGRSPKNSVKTQG